MFADFHLNPLFEFVLRDLAIVVCVEFVHNLLNHVHLLVAVWVIAAVRVVGAIWIVVV